MSSQSKHHLAVVENPALRLLNETVVKGFLDSYGNQSTRRSYRGSLGMFKEWISNLPEKHNSFNLLAEFKAYLQSRVDNENPMERLSSYTVNRCLAVVKRYTRFLYEAGLVERNYAETVKSFRQHSTHYRRSLDRNIEIPKLFDTIDRTTDIGIRDYAIITILAYTGIRGFELAEADYGDLDSIDGRPILWIKSKGKMNKSEYVFITDQPYKALTTYLERRGGLLAGSPLIVSGENGSGSRISIRTVRHRVDYWLKKAGLKTARVTTHSLRHSAAIAALKNGADIRAVQGMLRHSNPKTTMVYLQDISRQDKPAEDAISYGNAGPDCR